MMFANCHTMRGMLFHHHGQKEINDVCHLMRRMLFHHHGQKVGVTVIILLHPLCQASFLALPNWVCWYWEDKFQLVDIYISLYQMKGLGCVLHGMHENRVIHISYSLICKWAEKNWSQWYKPEKRIYYIKQVNSVFMCWCMWHIICREHCVWRFRYFFFAEMIRITVKWVLANLSLAMGKP